MLFGHRPFDFNDFFKLVMNGKIDFSNLNYIDVMRNSIDAGFKHIEITGDIPNVLPGLLSPNEINQLVEIKNEEEITFSVHLPLWAMEPAAFNEHIRDASITAFIDCIELTKPLDPICWVIHPTGALTVEFMNMNLPDFAKELIASQFCTFVEESISKLLTKIDIPSKKIAIENIEFPIKKMAPIIEKFDLSICFDTGHLMAGYSGKIGVIEFINKFSNRLVELHLHDGAYPRIDHKALGKHDLPVIELLSALNDRSFQGPLVFELSLDEAKESMQYIRNHIPEVLE
ncbi:MAG: sugar phosphate isomerase/epimerase [Asgard group archaeon]|nr:sugar phosphate isomerase/epimerase [Asgard group archaeon]